MTVELTPLTVDHAAAMVAVLADPSLYEFTGGTPPTLEELTARYARQAVGHSPDGTEQWLNWVVLLDSTPVGYVQATVVGDSAEIAWVISPSVQGRGLATEAARAMVELLTAAGVRRLVAHVHPDHVASARVAERLGLRPTDVVEDGEVRWVQRLPCRVAGLARRPGGAAPGPARLAGDHGDPLADRPPRSASTTPPASGRATTAGPPSRSLRARRSASRAAPSWPRGCTCSARSTTSG